MTDPDGTAPVTADEVREAALRTRRGGYDEGEVDGFLDEVAEQLDLAPAERTLTAQSVSAHVFGTTALRGGYVVQEVDDLLDAVAARLRGDELAATAQDAARAEPAGSTDAAAPGRSAPGRSAPVADPAALPAVPDATPDPAETAESATSGPASTEQWEPEARRLALVGGTPRGGRFRTVGRFSRGYQVGAVDDLVDRVVAWLPHAQPDLDPAEVARPPSPRVRRGYATADVDAWCAQVAGNLRTRAG